MTENQAKKIARLWPDRAIFQGSARAYLNWCDSGDGRQNWSVEKKGWDNLFVLQSGVLAKCVIVDFGSGVGRLIDLAIEHGAKRDNIFAVEPNPLMSELASKKGIMTIFGGCEDAGHELFKGVSPDLVTANMVLNHLDNNQFREFVTDVYGMLKSGGGFAFVVPHPKYKAAKHDFKYADNDVILEEEAPWGGMVIYRHRSISYVTQLLEKVGFEVVLSEYGEGKSFLIMEEDGRRRFPENRVMYLAFKN